MRMSSPVSVPPCPICARGRHGTWSCGAVPGWAEVVGSAGVGRLDRAAAAPLSAESALVARAELPPRPGEERAVRVRGPLLADGPGPFWVLFESALAAIDGYDDQPELLIHCAMVACTPVATLARGD